MWRVGTLLLVCLPFAQAFAGDPVSERLDVSQLSVATDLGSEYGQSADGRVERLRFISNRANLDAEVGDGVFSSVVTGANTISNSAFAGMSGIGTVVQNSGNQVVVQNSTIFNVSLY
ncbi:hypothetical protein [Craterilacuibacter sinensis]|uniref:Uncharacterized protein n=1 Tax=Craterilacuibacter sinensis TaxID=2686017 RepID=A0A845BKT2_9NEIS|nr:hypothetical protein [Craterilacuibacter sinensis]MXR36010.1 hypothetical protein [Craterilacuibacter sinensis]RQW28298.1 hypothetical protein EHS17_06125 [Rhodobacteraceae bacterium CH30]